MRWIDCPKCRMDRSIGLAMTALPDYATGGELPDVEMQEQECLLR